MGWIRELQEGKLEQDAELEGKKLEAKMWLIVARVGFLRNQRGFTNEVGAIGCRQWYINGKQNRQQQHGKPKYMHEYRGCGMQLG